MQYSTMMSTTLTYESVLVPKKFLREKDWEILPVGLNKFNFKQLIPTQQSTLTSLHRIQMIRKFKKLERYLMHSHLGCNAPWKEARWKILMSFSGRWLLMKPRRLSNYLDK